jgi:hypothetical protein
MSAIALAYTAAEMRHMLLVSLVAVAIGLLVAIVVLLLTGGEAVAPGPNSWRGLLEAPGLALTS